MAQKEFTYKGKTLEELQKMDLKSLAELFPARTRRTLKRGLKDQHKKLLKNIKESKKPVKTHIRDMVILPEMVDKIISIHNGKEFVQVNITSGMIGHRLGEFTLTRKGVTHSSPGVGATKSSSAVSVR